MISTPCMEEPSFTPSGVQPTRVSSDKAGFDVFSVLSVTLAGSSVLLYLKLMPWFLRLRFLDLLELEGILNLLSAFIFRNLEASRLRTFSFLCLLVDLWAILLTKPLFSDFRAFCELSSSSTVFSGFLLTAADIIKLKNVLTLDPKDSRPTFRRGISYAKID